MSLAVKLRELRQMKGVSLQKVADAVEVSKAHIWELEKGLSTNPGLELLTRLSSYYSVPVGFLADEHIPAHHAAPKQFFRDFGSQLSDGDWSALRAMAEHLKTAKVE